MRVVRVTTPNLAPPVSDFEPQNPEWENNIELYQAMLKIKQITDSIVPVLLTRGQTDVAEEIAEMVVKADEDILISVLQHLYKIVGTHLFPVNFPDISYLEEADVHLECIPIEPIWLEPIGHQDISHDGALSTIDAQLRAIFLEAYEPVEETYPELGLVALDGHLVAKELIQQHHGNSWKHCFGWYLLAMVHETGSWFYDEQISDEWIYEEIWAETVWSADLVSQFASAFDEAKEIERKIERFHHWVDRKPRKRYEEIVAFIQDFQRKKIQNYWRDSRARFFRTTFTDDAVGVSSDLCPANPMGW